MTVKTSTKPFPEMEFLELNSFSLGSFSRNVALNQLGVGRDGQFPLCKGFLCFQEAALRMFCSLQGHLAQVKLQLLKHFFGSHQEGNSGLVARTLARS